jgi:hypothetical protein
MRKGRNQEGYADPTASSAINTVSKMESEADKRAYNLVNTLKSTIHAAGFELIDHIQLKDTKSGRVYR